MVFQLQAGWCDITDQMRPNDEQRSRLLRLKSMDAEFAHTVVESSAVEPRRAAGPVGASITKLYSPILSDLTEPRATFLSAPCGGLFYRDLSDRVQVKERYCNHITEIMDGTQTMQSRLINSLVNPVARQGKCGSCWEPMRGQGECGLTDAYCSRTEI